MKLKNGKRTNIAHCVNIVDRWNKETHGRFILPPKRQQINWFLKENLDQTTAQPGSLCPESCRQTSSTRAEFVSFGLANTNQVIPREDDLTKSVRRKP